MVIAFDVVETDVAGNVRFVAEVESGCAEVDWRRKMCDASRGKCWIEDIANVF